MSSTPEPNNPNGRETAIPEIPTEPSLAPNGQPIDSPSPTAGQRIQFFGDRTVQDRHLSGNDPAVAGASSDARSAATAATPGQEPEQEPAAKAQALQVPALAQKQPPKQRAHQPRDRAPGLDTAPLTQAPAAAIRLDSFHSDSDSDRGPAPAPSARAASDPALPDRPQRVQSLPIQALSVPVLPVSAQPVRTETVPTETLQTATVQSATAQTTTVTVAAAQAARASTAALSSLSLPSRLEAILYLKGRPLGLAELAEIAGINRDQAELALITLMTDYAHRDTALEIRQEGQRYSLQLRESLGDLVQSLLPVDLSTATLRTLATIALKKRILQSELVDLRGSGAYDHIKELLAQEFIERRRQSEGRSYWLSLSEKFHRTFAVSADDLSQPRRQAA